ncbi:hypothetical protein J4466_05145 [Candidatus Pacearchaeota archaeon]|nr:hypothetical protein [Candidatus Pacearchaeota archaeon]
MLEDYNLIKRKNKLLNGVHGSSTAIAIVFGASLSIIIMDKCGIMFPNNGPTKYELRGVNSNLIYLDNINDTLEKYQNLIERQRE